MRIMICFLLCMSTALASPVINIGVDTLRFGYISVGGSHARDFRISNTGDLPLVVDNANLPDPAYVLLSPALPATIPGGESDTFTIDFRPVEQRTFNTNFSFHSNDPATPDAPLPAVARGVRVFQPGEVIWSYQGIENVVSCVAMSDVNGDGIEEVVAESFDSGASGNNLLCISGSGLTTGNLIWSARPLGGPSNSGGYGDQCLITIDDLNGNGTQDIILGTAWGSRTVFGIEGTTGQTLWSYDTYQHGLSGWIYSVASMGDTDGDSVPEVLAGAGSDANAAFCLDGADGERFWIKNTVDAVYSVCRIDDIDGDGISDAVLGAGDNDDLVYCISGASQGNGSLIWSYSTGGTIWSVDRIADIDADGYNDVIAGTWYNGNRVYALSGHSTGAPDVIWNVAIGNPVMRVVACPDLNGDGFEDVLVASWADYAIALSGADGSELWRNPGGDDVWAIYWCYDISGDSIPEVIAGSFTGNTILINGATGETIWSTPSNAKLFTVRPIRDVNGDGFADVVAGQQMLNSVGGKIFVISGGTVTPSSVRQAQKTIPADYLLLSNYPNPFNAGTVISYNLPSASPVALEIYDLMGQRIVLLADEVQSAGEHSITWGGRDDGGSAVSSGVYFARITANGQQSTRKMILLK